MKNLSRILWGIVLIFIGVIWGLNRTGVADINIFFDGWWTLFIIVPSAISFFEKGNNKISSLIFLIIGVLLLWHLVWKWLNHNLKETLNHFLLEFHRQLA